MVKSNEPGYGVDESLSTWEGSRREALRRWSRMPLECVVAALEEMQKLSERLSEPIVIATSVAKFYCCH